MNRAEKVLVVEDEAMIREAIASYLEKNGRQVLLAETGTEALEILSREPVSFVILDLMLPDLSGEEVCARIRGESRVPILMLTAKTMEEDLLNGLRIGADDYMTKPFSLKELNGRMEAILRRASEDARPLASVFCWNSGELEADFEQRLLWKSGRPVSLTPIEWNIFSALVKYPRKVFTRNELLLAAFGDDFDGYDRVIDTHIKNLRKKLEENPRQPVYILTVHGIGYRFGGRAD